MAEWSIAAVLKTVVLRGTGGSNPSLSAKEFVNQVFTNSFFISHFTPIQENPPSSRSKILKIILSLYRKSK